MSFRILRGAALAGAIGMAGVANAGSPTTIVFDPSGTGSAGQTVAAFDWIYNSALAAGANPSNGLQPGSKFTVFTQARLFGATDINNNPLPLDFGTEFTFVAAFGEAVTTCSGVPYCNNATFAFDTQSQPVNYFEMWVKTPPTSNTLAGTGFTGGKRILFGTVNFAAGNFQTSGNQCPNGGAQTFLDLFNGQSPGWETQLTLCGQGSSQLTVQVLQADPDYFPGFGPAQVANVAVKFNTSTVTPFQQSDPAQGFVRNSAGVNGTDAQTAQPPDLGAVNGQADGVATHDVEFQTDANQRFEIGEAVPGACRVTYGGNDKNGNIERNTFGEACMKVKGNEYNCYTFGGQVGAPTADPAFDGPFGEHTHHNVTGPAGDFVFHAGTHSAPKESRITKTACWDPGACRQAEANAGFKQIDFEGTGTFRSLDPVATAYLSNAAGHPVQKDADKPDQLYYFRVDMDDLGEPGNKAQKGKFAKMVAENFLNADQNNMLTVPDPLLSSFGECNQVADVYQFYICKDENKCEQNEAIYAVRGYLTGGNIQLHKVIK